VRRSTGTVLVALLLTSANAALLVAIAAVACLVPALRATRVNPIVAVRAEWVSQKGRVRLSTDEFTQRRRGDPGHGLHGLHGSVASSHWRGEDH